MTTPAAGDRRSSAPKPAGDGRTSADDDPAEHISTYFLSCNRNKQSIMLDLKSAAGRDALTELVRRGDVLLENFRPGVLDRLGFTMERLTELNPGLVVLSISGFGHDGPEGGRAGYDQIAQGEAGLMSMTGPDPETPTKVGVPISDLLAGMYGAFGVVAKLHERASTGLGGLVRTSLLASVVGVHAFQGTRWTVAGQIPKAEGPHHPSICPYGLFHCNDGIVQIAVGSEGLWARFAPAFDLPLDAPGFATNRRSGPQRRRRPAGGRSCLRELQDSRPAGQAQRDRGAQRRGEEPAAGLRLGSDPLAGPADRRRTSGTRHHPLPGPPLRFFEPTGEEWHREHTAPPLHGQHTDEVLKWLAEPAGS